MEEVRDHADRPLLRIDEQQHEIEKRRREVEGRALQLHDGRRFWLDGDRNAGRLRPYDLSWSYAAFTLA